MKSYAAVTSTFVFLSACSLYQSPGRKYLEQSSYQFAGLAAAERVADCGELADAPTDWVLRKRVDEARVWAPPSEDGRLRVEARDSAKRGCDFHFASANEAIDLTDAAIAATRTRF